MIPVYVINLARSPDRRAFMTQSLARAGVEPMFVTAVDGREQGWKEPVRGALAKTEAALILSHRKAWRRFLQTNSEFAAVLEDDAHIGEGFAALLAADWRGSSFDVADAVLHDRPIDYSALMKRALATRGEQKWARRFTRWRKAIWLKRLKKRYFG